MGLPTVWPMSFSPPPPPADNNDNSLRQSPPKTSSAIWRRINPTCACAFISRAGLSRRRARVVAVVADVIVDPSVGEASGRNTKRDDDDYDNNRPPS